MLLIATRSFPPEIGGMQSLMGGLAETLSLDYQTMVLADKFNFPYLFDETQEVAKKYGAVCTPDFFGYNKFDELQYRGRIRKLNNLKPEFNGQSELLLAMIEISKTSKGPQKQFPSMGCNIKWKNS